MPDRRAIRRQQTIDEINEIAVDLMTENGVNGLTLADIARRLGVQTPSLYKYYPSLAAIYDSLFERGMTKSLEVLRDGMALGAPGLDSLTRGLEALGRWTLANQALAQLMFWRPVPNFEPSAEAFAPSQELAALQLAALEDAVVAGQLGPEALEDGGLMVAVLIKGVLTQAMANEPQLPWGKGRYTPLFPRLMALLPLAYPPPPKPRKRLATRP